MEGYFHTRIASRRFLQALAALFVFAGFPTLANATDWYAAPNSSGTGTFSSPFDLQTALTSPLIMPGDFLYLRGGPYTGRFVCTLHGNATNRITVMSYGDEWAVLDGHVTPIPSLPDPEPQVLRVAAEYVTFRDFEVTYANVERALAPDGAGYCGGISDYTGSKYCEFINLVVHDNPGDGFDTWKYAQASLIYGCMIYNNGYLTPTSTVRVQHGPGMYIQNSYNEQKILKNNIVFNNFWVGFEAWSASSQTSIDFVKYLTFDDNTMFNNGMPASTSGIGETNMVVKTMDSDGSNVIRNINIVNNTIYHNTNYAGNITSPINVENTGEAPALEVGNITSAFPSDSIQIHNNYFSGRNPAVRINNINNLTFTNNRVLGRYVEIRYDNLIDDRINANNWHFDDNHYYTFGYTYLAAPGIWGDRTFRMVWNCGTALNPITCVNDYTLPGNLGAYVNWCNANNNDPATTVPSWKFLFPGLDVNSRYSLFQMNLNSGPVFGGPVIGYTNPPNVLKVTQNEYKPNQFKVVLLLPPTSTTPTGPFNVDVDFSSYNIPVGTPYTIQDVESFPAVADTGTYTGIPVTFDLNISTPDFNGPTGPGVANAVRTPGNFGVFLIEFASSSCVPNLTITNPVASNSNDFKQAGVDINALNEVNVSATAVYHAPEVVLKTDFHAANGSIFRAYTDGCTDTYDARLVPQAQVPVPEFPEAAEARQANSENAFVVHPNPGTGVFKVESAAVAIKRVVITAVDTNRKVFEKNAENSLSMAVNISKERKGMYIVQVYFEDGKVGMKKIVKN